MAERDPVCRLTLQFGIRQAIPLLKHQQPDHENDIIVQATASALGVRVEIGKERAKGTPVDQTADLTQTITQSSKGGISCRIAKLVNVLMGNTSIRDIKYFG